MSLQSGTSINELRQIDTNQLPPDGGPQYNRLVFSSSPYLLQHAENPIDWFPWSDEAFDKAGSEDRPVLISIGYSTCHWCHVMAHESFSDPEVADYLNRNFVAIKVDREERPDIDSTYMAACQMMTGSGGWPLTILANADKRPFYAATYLPKRSRQGLPGIMELMHKVMELWRSERTKLLQTGQQVSRALQQLETERQQPSELSEQPLRRAADQLRQQFDENYAGFGTAPKFPAPHNLTLLIQLSERFADPGLSEMAVATLRAIRYGGIYDQIGFGLHRYSVDECWLVPHFEKMLYDQALYILACLSAPAASDLADAATATVDYVLEQLRHPQGGFYCGEDADSEGKEGTFYLWTPEQVTQVLGEKAAANWNARYNICQQGHFEGKSIPHLEPQPAESSSAANEEIESWRLRLKQVRARRIRPHLDDKILTAWNGLMIAALARHAASGGQQPSLLAAVDAFDFVCRQLQAGTDRLLRSYCHGQVGSYGFLEDYACFSWGAAELYQASGELRHLSAALHWCEVMLELFSDGSGGLFDTAKDSEPVLTRGRSLQDGAVPSGTSVACYVLLKVGRLAGRLDLEQHGQALLEYYLGAVEHYPSAYTQLLQALDFALGPTTEITIIRGNNPAVAEQMLQTVRTARIRHLQHLLVDAHELQEYSLAPRISGQTPLHGKSTAYVCSGNRCLEAVTSAAELNELLESLQT